jgi:uncharacterized membrane protein YeaQ/YmgE (transglycosylase-associated protein family)
MVSRTLLIRGAGFALLYVVISSLLDQRFTALNLIAGVVGGVIFILISRAIDKRR